MSKTTQDFTFLESCEDNFYVDRKPSNLKIENNINKKWTQTKLPFSMSSMEIFLNIENLS